MLLAFLSLYYAWSIVIRPIIKAITNEDAVILKTELNSTAASNFYQILYYENLIKDYVEVYKTSFKTS